ncbi:N-acetyl-D-glucosamine kinase-like [Lolium rigidum]|uniref:N-acetyl-D-glucosamine kinase-like n=1 Tax=Lolium rigidum TaxID=89674 RepID=UPI001F5CF79A|nr:N-acetyl-D-glucosamine kinase-like [Lolium rigidum]
MGSYENGNSPAAARREGGVILGVDGGTTSTVCVCLPAAMPPPESPSAVPVLSRAIAGCSNRNSVGESAALETLEHVMTQALTMASTDHSNVVAVCLSVSGVNHPSDQQKMLDWIRTLFPGDAKFYVENDAVAALASGTMGKLHGCVLIAGTGSIAYGVTKDGKLARAAGAGPVLGDWGSGYGIAAQALTAVIKAHDGRGPQTNLTRAITRKLEIASPDELIGWTYADPSWARIAALVPVVVSAAEDGDEVANTILREAVQELADSVVAVVRRLALCGEDGKDQFPLVLVGGVLEGNKKWNISGEVIKCISKVFPGVHAIRPEVEPAVGAALLAWSHLHKESKLENGS